jgi:hypothetical protein
MTTDAACPRCGNAKHRGRCKGGGRVKVGEAPAVPEPVRMNGSFEIAAGFGIRASIESGTLQLEQDRQDGETIYTHTISLAPHEVRELIDFIARRYDHADLNPDRADHRRSGALCRESLAADRRQDQTDH